MDEMYIKLNEEREKAYLLFDYKKFNTYDNIINFLLKTNLESERKIYKYIDHIINHINNNFNFKTDLAYTVDHAKRLCYKIIRQTT